MQIYIHHDNQQLGPFSLEEVKAQLASGAISLQDSVWWQGEANWIPLEQSSLAASLTGGTLSPAHLIPSPFPGAPAVPASTTVAGQTSNFALWSLVCGCSCLLCGIFAIPAIVLGHLGRTEIKKNPALKGNGMALTGLIIGYLLVTLMVISLIAIIVLEALGAQVKDTFKTINAQIEQAQDSTNSSDSNNSPVQSTNSTDNSTNAAPTTP